MYAWFTDPGTLMPGVSGATLFNGHNQVIGIAKGTGGGTNLHSHAFATQISACDIRKVFERQDTDENTIQSVTFFHRSIAAFMPVEGHGVQEILQLRPAFAQPQNRVHVHVFGYPEQLCIAYHRQIHTSRSRPPAGDGADHGHLHCGQCSRRVTGA
ncbi:hypothetical protein [Komagataeibacter xylinus]|uniref:Uncharacterized protein n=1 Tax=Komagataeibacter xylinus TaxID=28448 RepID=A0A857FLV8_KOMXY|nr:hypothetical protein [Komagataeibacter xylinus]QHC35186.1 hypothetical protein FMA36_06415 [Komagataeibacter xylinus]